MKNLFKFEFRKLWQSKSLYIIFGLGLFSIILIMLLGKLVTDVFNVTPNATVYLLSAISAGSVPSLVGIYLAIFACSDNQQHTIKNVYARGYSRDAVFFTKYLVSLMVTFAVAILYILFAFVFALILGGRADSMAGYMWGKLALQFWILFGLHGLYYGVSQLTGKMVISLVINIVGIGLVFTLLNALISIITSKANIDFSIFDYNLEMMLSNLLGEDKLTTAQLVRALVVPFAYAAVFITGGWFVNRRRDV